MSFLRASRWSFFKSLLGFGVSFRDRGPWFAQPEPELVEEPLALPNSQLHAVLHPDVVMQ